VQELTSLQALLEHQEPQGLVSCWDYVSLPLLLIVDSAVQARLPLPSKGAAGTSQEAGSGRLDVAIPAATSDRVAEAVLGESCEMCGTAVTGVHCIHLLL
jgi:hypothetical protein